MTKILRFPERAESPSGGLKKINPERSHKQMAEEKKESVKSESAAKESEGEKAVFEFTVRELANGEIKVIPLTEGATEQDVYQHVEDMAANIHYQRQAVAIMPYVQKAAQEAARDAVQTVFEVLSASQQKPGEGK
jgi:hypothetical protein